VKIRLTASKADLVQHCVYWASGELQYEQSEPGYPAQIGTQVHKAVEGYWLSKSGKATGWLDGVWRPAVEKFDCLVDWVDSLPENAISELAFKANVFTWESQSMTLSGPRAYGEFGDGEIGGTADFAWSEGDAVHVVDIKTGKRANTTPALFNGQLATLALMAMPVFQAKRAIVSLVFPNTETRTHELDTCELQEVDLHYWRGAWRLAFELLQHGTARPVSGDHCKKCDARNVCPGSTTLSLRKKTQMQQSKEQA
jgi:hypothetical protein